MIVQNFYNIILLIAAAVNVIMGCALLMGNASYGNYTVYRRSRLLTALTFLIFAAGFIAHSQLGWRATWPAGASALSVSYFHAAAVLFGWSHISLLNPNYLTRRITVRDITILVVGIVAYWTAAASSSLVTFHFSLLIFFLHALYISFVFYHTLVRVRMMTGRLPQSDDNARWWTDDNRMMVMGFQRSIRVSCHLIIIFGLGSIVVTAAFPNEQWPYIILMALGIAVFCYIYYGLTNYGTVIEAGTNATEDVAEGKKSSLRLVLTLALMMTALTAWADSEPVSETVSYIDADGSLKSESATILTGSTSPTTLDAGWYVVKGNVTYNGQLEFNKGEVNLILCDGATITVSSGVSHAILVEGDLTIYAQSGGSGALETNTTYNFSGIHANDNGHIIINGGHITTQSTNGPGISTNGDITINSGNVETTCTNDHGLRAKYITLGWRNAADRINVKKYELEGGGALAVAEGKTITDGNGNIYSGTLDADKIIAIANKSLMGTNLLYDTGTEAAGNTTSIGALADAGTQTNITLSGRTLYKDGKWNTLCLPFNVTISGSILEGATVKKLTASTSSLSGTTLTLNFEDESTTMTAGTPYIIKWGSGDALVNPTFAGVTVSSNAPTPVQSTDTKVEFRGNYSPVPLAKDDKSSLYLGIGKNAQNEDVSTLYWPSANKTIGAFRAYFHVDLSSSAPELNVVLNFGDGETTSLREISNEELVIRLQRHTLKERNYDYYTLDGRKLQGRPTQKGLYIHNGKKMMIQ